MHFSSSLRRSVLLFLLAVFIAPNTFAQKKQNFPEDNLKQSDLAADLRFLASDELMGRMTGTASIEVAARYIAEQFRANKLDTLPGVEKYFQKVPLVRTKLSREGYVLLLGDTLRQGKDILARSGKAIEFSAPMVYIGNGFEDTLKSMDIKGKIVAAKFQTESAAEKKRKVTLEQGALALIEFQSGNRPWQVPSGLFEQGFYGLETDADPYQLPYIIVDDAKGKFGAGLEKQPGLTVSINCGGVSKEPVPARNVLGVIQGSDPKLRDEYVLLMAHYDHVGAGLKYGATPEDTIFNGARDNGMGTVALLAAARSLSLRPPARSVLIAAVTGEEIGLLGSKYLADNLPVPLEKIVYLLNSDGAGFNDTTVATVIGLERTTAEQAIKSGTARYGLTAIPDPAPGQQLFDRSDNVRFARKGIPAPTFSPGFRAFDAEISKYYHRPADEANDDFNYSYLLKFCKAFVHSARLIADMKTTPRWKAGDLYEAVGKKLYGK